MNPFIAFIKLIRLPNLLIIALTQYAIRYGIIELFLSNFSADVEIGLLMSDLDFFLLSLSTVMIAAAGYIINDYFDIKIDRVNRPDKIIVGKYIKRRVCMGAHIVINTLAIFIAAYVAYQMHDLKLVLIQIISVSILWYYSVNFKRQVIVGNVVVALLAALVPFVAGFYEYLLQINAIDDTVNRIMFFVEEGTPFEYVKVLFESLLVNIMYWVLGFSFFAFLSTIIREVVKDIEDVEGDKKYDSKTLVVVYGIKKSKLFAQVFAIVMFGIIAYLQYTQFLSKDLVSVMYLSFTVQAPLVYTIYQLQVSKNKSDFTKMSLLMKLVMLAGILYIGLYYYSVSQAI